MKRPSLSLYDIGRGILLLTFIGAVACSAALFFLPEDLELVLRNEFSNPVVFGRSLSLVLNFMTILFLVVIFLIQNTTQEYSSRLSRVIFKNKYFVFILLFILGFSLFNLAGEFLVLAYPYDLISFIFSVGIVLVIVSMILFTGYFLSIPNVVDYVTQKIVAFVRRSDIYKQHPFNVPIQDDQFTEELNNRTHLLLTTCDNAIQKNQRNVVEACFTAFNHVTDTYLDRINDQDTDEKYLNELNDRYRFLMDSCLEDYTRQKYLEDLAKSIGDVAISIYNADDFILRENQLQRWLRSLKNLFVTTYGLDRNVACGVCIDTIGDITYTALDDEDYEAYQTTNRYLKDIGDLCAELDDTYSSSLLQSVFQKYGNNFVKLLSLVAYENWQIDQYKFERFFNDIYEQLETASENRSSLDRQAVFAGIHPLAGFNSYNGKLSKLPLGGFDNARTELLVKEALEEYLRFYHRVLIESIPYNITNITIAYPELVFLLNYNVKFEFMDEYDYELLTQLLDYWIGHVDANLRYCLANKEIIGTNEHISDFSAVLVFVNRDELDQLRVEEELVALGKLSHTQYDSQRLDLLEEHSNRLVEMYEDLKSDADMSNVHHERVVHRLYSQMKLYGCWMSQYYELQEVSPELFEVLKDDLKDISDNDRMIPRSDFVKYGYPPRDHSDLTGTWYLSPSSLWGPAFQEQVSAELNGDGAVYREFHEYLEQEAGS